MATSSCTDSHIKIKEWLIYSMHQILFGKIKSKKWFQGRKSNVKKKKAMGEICMLVSTCEW